MKHIQQFPHCDPRILHAPEDNCQFCNEHEDWQELRRMWGIAFTGHSYDKQGNPFTDEQGNVILPCPAQYNRGMTSVNGWHGNVAFTPEVEEAQKKFFGDLAEKWPDDLGYDPEELEKSVGIEPTFGKKVTLSGKPADPNYHGSAPQDIDPVTGQHKDYWVLAPEELAKGLVRPVRHFYKHLACGGVTTMGLALAQTYARDPKFYGSTFCATCRNHFPVGEFTWIDGGAVVGS